MPQSGDDIPETAERKSSSLMFDAQTLKAGDVVGAFVASEVRPYKPYKTQGAGEYEFNEPQGPNNIYVHFSGVTTVEGSFAYGRDREIGEGIIITDLTLKSRAQLPQQARDGEGRSSFSISNPEVIDADFKTGDKVQVVITDYQYIGYPAGGMNKAGVQSIREL